MKRTILIVIIIVSAKLLFAQNSMVSSNPNIVYKPDTIHYVARGYRVAPNAKVAEMLKVMEGFVIGPDTTVRYQGQPVNFVRVNGKHYDGMNVTLIITKLPVDIVDNIEVIDDYSSVIALTGAKSGVPQKLLNINLKKNLIVDSHSFNPGAAAFAKHKPTTAQLRTDIYGRGRFRHTDQFNIEDRTETDRLITRQIAQLQADIASQGKDVDQYGDQIPHSLIRPNLASRWSKSAIK